VVIISNTKQNRYTGGMCGFVWIKELCMRVILKGKKNKKIKEEEVKET
jgi:hypothetical protein